MSNADFPEWLITSRTLRRSRRPSDKRRDYKHPPKGSDKNRDEVLCLQRLTAFGRWSA